MRDEGVMQTSQFEPQGVPVPRFRLRVQVNLQFVPALRTILLFAMFLVAISPTTAQVGVSAPTTLETGPHHRVWQTTRVDAAGQTNVSSYTELATGLNFLNAETGQYELS